MKKYFNSELYNLTPYIPGEQPAINRKIIKLNTNENPFPPSAKIVKSIQKVLRSGALRKYPNPISKDLIKELAKLNKVDESQILVVNGSDEGLALLFKATLENKDTIVMPFPTYSLYPVLSDIAMRSCKVNKIPLKNDFHFDFDKLKKSKGKFLTFAYPNAPTGILEKKENIIDLIKNFDGIVLCDEAYIDFAPEGSSLVSELNNLDNLIISRTFSKSYSLAGLRVGYLIGSSENISLLYKLKDSYNVGMLPQAIAIASVQDRKYFKKNIKKIISERNNLKKKLESIDFFVLDSDSNFLFAKPPCGITAEKVFLYLKENNIFIRYFKDDFCKDYIRISIGSERENKILVDRIRKLMVLSEEGDDESK